MYFVPVESLWVEMDCGLKGLQISAGVKAAMLMDQNGHVRHESLLPELSSS